MTDAPQCLYCDGPTKVDVELRGDGRAVVVCKDRERCGAAGPVGTGPKHAVERYERLRPIVDGGDRADRIQIFEILLNSPEVIDRRYTFDELAKSANRVFVILRRGV